MTDENIDHFFIEGRTVTENPGAAASALRTRLEQSQDPGQRSSRSPGLTRYPAPGYGPGTCNAHMTANWLP